MSSKQKKTLKRGKKETAKVPEEESAETGAQSSEMSDLMRIVEDSGIISPKYISQMKKFLSKCQLPKEELGIDGDIVNSAELAIMAAQRTTKDLSEHKQVDSSPFSFALLRAQILRDNVEVIKQEQLEKAKICQEMREKFVRNKIAKRVASVSECAVHSYYLRKILGSSDIDLPYCLNLDVFVEFIEGETQFVEYIMAESHFLEAPGVCIIDPTNGQRLLNAFQQTFPLTYVELVRKNLPMIRKNLNDHFISMAKNRREPGYESSNPFTFNSENRQKMKEEMTKVVASEWKAAKNKKISKKTDDEEVVWEKIADPYLSTRSQLLVRCGLKGSDNEIQSQIEEHMKGGKDLMAAGELHKGAQELAITVLISDQSEQLLKSLKEDLPPDHFALVRKKMVHIEQGCKEVRNSVLSRVRNLPENMLAMPVGFDSDSSQKVKRKKIVRPEHIPEDFWKRFYDLGRHFSDFILDALAVYESGDFTSWGKSRVKNMESALDKNNEVDKRYRRNLVCEYVLIERMKEKDFFCCDLCQMVLYNYKQALIHFATSDHYKKETDVVRDSGIDSFRHVLKMISDLPKKLRDEEVTAERNRWMKNGVVDSNLLRRIHNHCETRFHPNQSFYVQWLAKYCSLTTNYFTFTIDPKTGQKRLNVPIAATTVVERVKGEEGRKALAELHEHLGGAPTYCNFCHIKTGDRYGFFAHQMSYCHVASILKKNDLMPNITIVFECATTIVNVLKKDTVE